MEDLHEQWPHRWVTSKAKAIHSKIHGIGVEAKEDIKKGENIVVFGGIVIPTTEIREYWNKVGHIGIQISDDFFIVPSTREEIDRGGVFNHSCSPNCGFNNTFTLIAILDIDAGEELTFDYAFCETTNDEFECKCDSDNCRKIIKESDWEIKNIQEKFGRYFSPYLKSKFSS
ncbi:SET domain-containing protein-lysine N-methyltransferase [archaeon]|jgi:uncharacterized protein|nr:SET domain-containing protein-lysine N-methyltransferase [archaeon]